MEYVSEFKNLDKAIEALNFSLNYFDISDFLFDLHNVVIAQGWSEIAEKTGLAREGLYRVLDPNAKPRFETVVKVLKAMNLQIQLIPAKKLPCQINETPRKYSLANKAAHLVVEWHPQKNHNLQPLDVTPTSRKIVWWCCPENHEWQATVAHRIKGEECPYCKAKNLLKKLEEKN